MSGNRNGSESEGLGFNLCVALSRVVVSLCFGTRETIGVWNAHAITKEFLP